MRLRWGVENPRDSPLINIRKEAIKERARKTNLETVRSKKAEMKAQPRDTIHAFQLATFQAPAAVSG